MEQLLPRGAMSPHRLSTFVSSSLFLSAVVVVLAVPIAGNPYILKVIPAGPIRLQQLQCPNGICPSVFPRPTSRRYGQKSPTTVVGEVEKYIVGGSPVKPGEFPFLVAITKNSHLHCGGSIITPRYVLTAMHCCFDLKSTKAFYSIESFEIHAGEHNMNRKEGWEQVGFPKRCLLYANPLKSPGRLTNDQGLFELRNAFILNRRVNVVPLPAPEAILKAGTECTVIGWGRTTPMEPGGKRKLTTRDEFRFISDIPLKANVPTLPTMTCARTYPGYFHSKTMVCAGFEKGKVDACKGDSGGPLMCSATGNASETYQFGIVSFGDGCAYPELYGVYALVPPVRQWIRNITKT